MKTNLLITSLSLIATSAYAQSSIPSVGVPPPTVRAEMPRVATPSMPQPAIQRPAPQMNQSGPQPAVGAAGGNGGNGGNGGLLVGNGGSGATPMPPLPANDVKGPTSVGASQSEAQAKARLEETHENSSAIFANANFQSPIMQTVESAALASTVNPGDKAQAKAQRREMEAKLNSQKAKAKAQRLENAVEGPTSVGATGATTPMPSMPANDVKGPTSVGGHH